MTKDEHALAAEVEDLRAALVEATAELIYIRQYGRHGAIWWANESKDVWREKARVALGVEEADDE
jgi:hypothetical protein